MARPKSPTRTAKTKGGVEATAPSLTAGSAVAAKPAGYHSVTPYLFVRAAADAIAFYVRAFDAVELARMSAADGRVSHAEIRIGDSPVMLCDELPGSDFCSPVSLGGCSSSLMVYVDDVDALFARALEAGAVLVKPVETQFWGDRLGTLKDPFGHLWSLATHVEDLPLAEMEARVNAYLAEQRPTAELGQAVSSPIPAPSPRKRAARRRSVG